MARGSKWRIWVIQEITALEKGPSDFNRWNDWFAISPSNMLWVNNLLAAKTRMPFASAKAGVRKNLKFHEI
jgi:hypothetical protein